MKQEALILFLKKNKRDKYKLQIVFSCPHLFLIIDD